ncbi:thiopurine S-methyltransferase [Alteromonas sp. ASW11-19]|uniref:Thiopurine S-methyltransferase n=1 Tax=Alteromonas salexigens TaxID=2982530 RepID=A0ABT2VPQ5_9ALTE|nr:thiopurine S-methyltransferase [Alteromonas salexigens]MCU7555307.1 thiopurine S-methyltransferase [Alteromonas salexigens]
MDHAFWHSKWQNNHIAFHEPQGSPLLVAHHPVLTAPPSPRVLVPLCGKTRDIGYLLSKGCEVVGVELSELAINQLFDELGESPEITQTQTHKRYSIPGLTVFEGDFFALQRDDIGAVTGVYDRAALIALPASMRGQYAQQVNKLSGGAEQLLICVDYKQADMPGPPFAVSTDEVTALYAPHYSITLLASEDVAGKLKGKVPACNQVYRLSSQTE